MEKVCTCLVELQGELVISSSVRPVLRAGYGLGILLTVVPVAEVWLTVRPLRPSLPVWRVGALGELGTSVMLPLIGAFVLVGTALMLKDGRMLRALSVVAAGMAVLLAAALLVFARDVTQLRAARAPEMLPDYPFTFAKVVLAYATTIWVSGWLSVGSYRVWHAQMVLERKVRRSVLVVREPGNRPDAAQVVTHSQQQ